MSDHVPRRNEVDSADESADDTELRTQPHVRDGIADTDVYEVEGGVVLYDVDNPLAWVEADSAVDVEQMV